MQNPEGAPALSTRQNASPAAVGANPGGVKYGGLSAGALKIIAIVAMFIDHAAYAFVPYYYSPLGTALHFIGRITGPVMFYFVVEGYHHTRSKNRYTLRMALFAILSYLPFIYFMFGTLPNGQNYTTLNVIYTLFIGLLALRVRHEVANFALQVVLIAGLLVLSLYGDWGYTAVLVILLFDYFRGHFRSQAVAYSAIVLTRVLPLVSRVLFDNAPGMGGTEIFNILAPVLVAAGMFLPLGLLYFYNGRRGAGGKWLFYVFYPAHLLLLGLLEKLLGYK